MDIRYSRYSWVFLGIIIWIGTMNNAQRFCNHNSGISFIAAGSNLLDDTNTTNTEYGLITGPAFLLIYALVTLPMVISIQGHIIDKLPRLKWFIVGISALFNLATVANALAQNFFGLLWPRTLLAIFSACLDPACFRLVALYFPPLMRGIAYGLFIVSVYLGSSLASLTLILADVVGWRASFIIVGAFGGISSVVLCLFIKDEKNILEEEDGFIEKKQKTGVKEDFKELFKNKTLIITIIATFFRYTSGFARGFYEALYFTGYFPNDKIAFAVVNATATALVPISLITAGRVSDLKERDNKPKWRPLICGYTNLFAAPFLYVAYLIPVFWVAMACEYIIFLVGETYISISVAMMMNVSTPRVRALQSAMLLCASFLGGSLSTVTLGVLNSSTAGLRYGLIGIVPTGYLIAGILFLQVSKYYPGDLPKNKVLEIPEIE